MNAETLIKRIKSKDKSEEDWLKLHADILAFLDSGASKEDKEKFAPLGYLEMVSMVCDGIMRERKKRDG